MFELEGPHLTVRRFELDLDMPAFVHEPDVRRTGSVRETAGLASLDMKVWDSGQKFADCVFDFCFRSHKKFHRLYYIFRQTHCIILLRSERADKTIFYRSSPRRAFVFCRREMTLGPLEKLTRRNIGMPKMDKQYQLILGTFIDDEFVWHDVDSFDDLEEAYKEFKKYVNSQLKYTDEELIKVWNTGRLDVELRRGNKLLNWVGIYAREVAREAKEDEDDKADIKDSVERLFEDERGERVTESELREEFEQIQADQPGEYNYSFEEYVRHCTGRHGTLKQIR